jgi:hypothetical protein
MQATPDKLQPGFIFEWLKVACVLSILRIGEMDRTLVAIIGAGTALAALALAAQLGVLFALFRLGRRMNTRLKETGPRIEALTEASSQAYRDLRGDVVRVTAAARKVIELARRGAAIAHGLRDDVAEFVEHERKRIDVVFNDAVDRARKTAQFVGRGLATPIRTIARGINGATRLFRHAA